MRKPAKKAADAVTTLKAAIYIRVSTQYQVDRASLPVQREELINYAKYALDITDSIIEDEAQVVLHIYDLYESVKSLTTVAKSLNEKGVRSRTGKPWNPTTVRTMLTNPFYAGTYRYNYWDESSKSFTVKDKDEWVLVLDHHPAIVTPEQQEIIAGILQSKQRGWAGAGMTYQRKNIHIFAGLLKCGYCGYTMIASPDRERSDG